MLCRKVRFGLAWRRAGVTAPARNLSPAAALLVVYFPTYVSLHSSHLHTQRPSPNFVKTLLITAKIFGKAWLGINQALTEQWIQMLIFRLISRQTDSWESIFDLPTFQLWLKLHKLTCLGVEERNILTHIISLSFQGPSWFCKDLKGFLRISKSNPSLIPHWGLKWHGDTKNNAFESVLVTQPCRCNLYL